MDSVSQRGHGGGRVLGRHLGRVERDDGREEGDDPAVEELQVEGLRGRGQAGVEAVADGDQDQDQVHHGLDAKGVDDVACKMVVRSP